MSEIDIKKFKAMLEGLDAGLDIKRSALVVRKASQSVEAQQTLRARKQTVADTIKLMRLLKPLIQAKADRASGKRKENRDPRPSGVLL